jgi:hypothetical protein
MSSDGIERPTDSDGYTVRILTVPPSNRARFTEWAKASAFDGDQWALIGPNGNVVERYLPSNTEHLDGGES